MPIPTKSLLLRSRLYAALRDAASADRTHPKEFVSFCASLEEAAMRALAEYDPSFAKAAEAGEPTFTLRAQDAFAAPTVEYWIRVLRDGRSRIPPLVKADEAELIASAMRAWPNRKLPD